MTPVNQDFEDLLRELNDAGVEYLIVGAHALAVHGHVRATGDLDVFVRPTEENASRVVAALERFGAPLVTHGVTAADFARRGSVYQLGLPPNRIDLLTEISGLTWDEASADRVAGQLGAQPVTFIGPRAQLTNKRSAGRAKDLADAEVLERLVTGYTE